MPLRKLSLLGILLSAITYGQDIKTLDDPHLYKAVYDGFAAQMNIDTASRIAYQGLTEKDPPEVPGILQKRIENANTTIKSLKEIRSADKELEKIRSAMCDILEFGINTANALTKGMKEALKDNRWSLQTSDLAQKLYEACAKDIPVEAFTNFYNFAMNSREFRVRCPESLEIYLALDEEPFISLGVTNFTDETNKTLMRVVTPHDVGHALGFRSGDVVKTFDSKPVVDMRGLKRQIKEAEGKKVAVIVYRDGKDQTLTLDVPDDVIIFDYAPKLTKAAKELIQCLIDGRKVDRALFTENCQKDFTSEVEQSNSKMLQEVGKLDFFKYIGTDQRENQYCRSYEIRIGGRRFLMNQYMVDDGKDGKVDRIVLGPYP